MTRAEMIEDFTARAVAAFRASGREYTCQRVIYDIIDPVIREMCKGTRIRVALIRNRAISVIHEGWLASHRSKVRDLYEYAWKHGQPDTARPSRLNGGAE